MCVRYSRRFSSKYQSVSAIEESLDSSLTNCVVFNTDKRAARYVWGTVGELQKGRAALPYKVSKFEHLFFFKF